MIKLRPSSLLQFLNFHDLVPTWVFIQQLLMYSSRRDGILAQVSASTEEIQLRFMSNTVRRLKQICTMSLTRCSLLLRPSSKKFIPRYSSITSHSFISLIIAKLLLLFHFPLAKLYVLYIVLSFLDHTLLISMYLSSIFFSLYYNFFFQFSYFYFWNFYFFLLCIDIFFSITSVCFFCLRIYFHETLWAKK